MPLLVFVSCAEPRRADALPVERASSRVDVFVRASGAHPETLTMHLAAVELRDEEGGTRSLELGRDSLSSAEAGRRLSLAGSPVEPGVYDALILELTGASLERDGRRVPLRLIPAGLPTVDAAEEALLEQLDDATAGSQSSRYEVPIRVELRTRDAFSIFLDWRVEESLVEGTAFRPVFGVATESPRVSLGLLYVTDAATDSVLAVDPSRGEVVGTGKVGSEPLGVAITRDRRLLVVANAGDGSVSLVDVQQQYAVSTIPIRFSAGTSDIAVVQRGRLVAATNPGLDTVSFIDIRTTARLDDARVGRRPTRLVAAPVLRRLFVVDSLSDDVSVIDVNSRRVVATLAVESRPTDIALDRREREIYVGHRISRNLLVFDAESLVQLDSVFVGGDVSAVLADRHRDRIYVARTHPAEIAVVDRRLSAVTRRIPISGRISALAQPVEGPLIYGAAPELGGVIAVNVVAGTEEPLTPCGTTPSDLVVTD